MSPSNGGSTLEAVSPAGGWDALTGIATRSGLTTSTEFVGEPAFPQFIDLRRTFFEIPRSIVRTAPGATNAIVHAPVAWQAQLVEPAQADYYEHPPSAKLAWTAAILAGVLEYAASGRSSMRRVKRLPAYKTLLSLEQAGIVTALKRLLGPQRPLWLAFLRDAVSERPADGAETIDDAAYAWQEWGRRAGLLV